MNKKLLSSSALVGAMLISGTALAEFKVGADVTATVIFGGHDDSTAGENQSGNRIGNETNITFSGNKDLANGLKAIYAGKFEYDKQNTGISPDLEHELKIQNGDFYVSFANDGGQTHKTHLTPFISYTTGTSAQAITAETTSYASDTHLGVVTTANNIGIGGKIGGGNFILRYAPNTGKDIPGDDAGKLSADDAGDTGSGMMAAYAGTFGGVGVALGYTAVEKDDNNIAGEDDATEKRIGLSYNFGQVRVGMDHVMFEAGTHADGEGDHDTTLLGVAYKASDTVSIGAYYQETTDEEAASTKQDEVVKMLSVGYNLGGASVSVNLVDVEGNGNALAGAKDDSQGIMITTKVGF
jgi:hypothetical protein